MSKVGNLAASIRQRLLNQSRDQRRPFNELLQYYAMERFLYRLSQSVHRECFVLKGALMLRVWQAPEVRPTMDIDMLGRTDNSAAAILAQVREILATPVREDGLEFDADSLQAESIIEDANYQGLRVRFIGALSGARIVLQLDLGFGDVLVPEAQPADFPTLLDLPAPSLLCYSRESAIAEKFEAMVKLGDLNSRMKDFYDIWLLARQFDFDGIRLAEAIRQTFKRRNTALPTVLPFEGGFVSLKQPQWRAFHKRLPSSCVPEQLSEVVGLLCEFLAPLVRTEDKGGLNPVHAKYWSAPGPWRILGGCRT